MTEVSLSAVGITHRYDRSRTWFRRSGAAQHALSDVTFEVAAGECVGIVGRSGSGKSTLLKVLLALERPSEGRVLLGDSDVRAGSPSRVRWFRRRVQYVPQEPGSSLEPRMTVAQLISEPLKRLDVPGDHRRLTAAAVDDVGLSSSMLQRRPAELSGGQAQRVAIARAIVSQPDFLLADEPVSGLDLPMRNHVITLLQQLTTHRTLGLVFVSHDLDAVSRLCGRSVVLASGCLVEAGPTAALLTQPRHQATQELVDAIPALCNGAS